MSNGVIFPQEGWAIVCGGSVWTFAGSVYSTRAGAVAAFVETKPFKLTEWSQLKAKGFRAKKVVIVDPATMKTWSSSNPPKGLAEEIADVISIHMLQRYNLDESHCVNAAAHVIDTLRELGVFSKDADVT